MTVHSRLLQLVLVAALAGWTTTAFTAPSSAYDPRTSGQDGQAFGKTLKDRQAAALPTFTEGGEKNAGEVTVAGEKIPVNQLVPGADGAKAEELKQLHNATKEQLEAAAQTKKAEIANDPRATASAYRTVVNQKRVDRDSLSQDTSLWSRTREILSEQNLGLLQDQYADCKTTTTYFKSGTMTGRLTHESTCEQLNGRDGASRERTVTLTTRTETAYQQQLSVLQDSDVSFPVANPVTGIVSADVTLQWAGSVRDVVFTDYPTAFNNWMVGLHVTYDPALAQQVCNLPNGNVCAPGSPDCTCHPGAAVASIEVTAQIQRLNETIASSPEPPLLDSDGFCNATWKCEDSTPRVINGTTIDTAFADALTPLYPTRNNNLPPSSMAPICWRASATYDCPYNLGDFGCWTTPSGERKCHTNTPGNTVANTCHSLVVQGCTLRRRECAEGATGWGGACYVENQVYDCPEEVAVDSIDSRSTTACAGAVRCMGNDCLNDPQPEHAQGFATTHAKLTLLQHVLSDTSTDTRPTTVQHPDGTSNAAHGGSSRPSAAPASATPSNGVTLFRGEAYECRKALGSTVDCCSEADSGGEKKWMDLYVKHERQGNAQAAEAQARADGDTPKGSWADLADPRNRKLATLQNKGFTSRRESYTEGAQPSAQTGPIGNSQDMKPVMDEYRREEASDEGMRNSWSCSAAEMDLAVQREAGACVNLGSYCHNTVLGACIEKRDVYCCFNSPLTRAMRVQMAGGQEGILAGAFGTPKAPRCEGVLTEQVNAQVIEQTPLEDFIGRLKKADALPTLENLQSKTSEEKLTGQGSTLVRDTNQSRPTVSQRTQQRVAAIDPDATASALHAEAVAMIPEHQVEPNVAGTVGFAPAYNHAVLGQDTALRVMRWGSAGPASVRLTIVPDTALPNVHYLPIDAVVRWSDGESGSKEVPLHTLRPTVPVTQGLRATLKLSDASSGVLIDPGDTGYLVFEPTLETTGPALSAPSLSVTKQLQAATWSDHDHGWLLDYRIVVRNDGNAAATQYTVSDETPPHVEVRQWGDPSYPGWTRYCATPGVTQHGYYTYGQGMMLWCGGTQRIEPGTSFELRAVLFLAEPATTVTNVCYAEYQGVRGEGHRSAREQCTVTSQLTVPGASATGCEGRETGLNNGYPVASGLLADYYAPGFPGDGGAHGLPLRSRATSAYAFVPGSDGVAVQWTVSTDVAMQGLPPGYKPAAVVYARISPCAGDLSLPTNSPADPFSMQSCTTVQLGAGGVITNKPILSLEVTANFPSDEGTCRLIRGRTYYLNLATNDATDATVTLGDDQCSAPLACVVNLKGE